MTSLHVICDLGPPNQKSWLRLWALVPSHFRLQPPHFVWSGDGTAVSVWLSRSLFLQYLSKLGTKNLVIQLVI